MTVGFVDAPVLSYAWNGAPFCTAFSKERVRSLRLIFRLNGGVSNRAGVAQAELGSSVGQGYDLGRSGTPRCVF